jgi:SAM-dependent methyltransferase
MFRLLTLSLFTIAALSAQDPEQVQIDTPYVASPPPVVDAMLSLAHTKSSDIVYDLGCGDGRILIEAAKQYGARGVGIDNNPKRIHEANENAARAGVSHLVSFRLGDLYQTDLADATLVTLYLLPDVNLRLRPKLQAQLPRGARVVSHTFDMGDWKPRKEQSIEGTKVYLWTIRKRFWFFG